MTKKENWQQLWTDPSCAICILNIAYQTISRSTKDIKIQFECIKKTFQILGNFSNDAFPTDISLKIFRMIQESTNNKDPFRKEKKDGNSLGRTVSRLIKADINETRTIPERIYKAIIGTIVGNIIDYATDRHNFNLDPEEFKKLYSQNLEIGFKINHFDEFMRLLEKINNIMYVVDNAGEIAFDKILIEELLALKKKVTVVLKEDAISNDATFEDAYEVGLDKIDTELITTGSNALGIMINELSDEFLKKLEDTDLIIAKGQANWETLTYYKDFFKVPILFILRAKCLPIAKFLGVNVRDNIIKFVKRSN
ncbi:MAG: damage-control phosphatase ARMT1 family protein [Candidatus Helarchaeota archaeon]